MKGVRTLKRLVKAVPVVGPLARMGLNGARAFANQKPFSFVFHDAVQRRVIAAKAAPVAAGEALFPLTSGVCRLEYFRTRQYRHWCSEFKAPVLFKRKQWEYFFIAQALLEQDMLKPGRKGLGFGVGEEPLAALFAKLGCEILATDLHRERAAERGWTESSQHAAQKTILNQQRICPAGVFADNVGFQFLDMNAIPPDLAGFDFCWSACALEHLGSIEAGNTFIENSLACLKPGGVALHTTEFNVASNDATLAEGGTVLFRRRDLEGLAARLAKKGHQVFPIRFEGGGTEFDAYVDVPPFRDEPHLKVQIEGFVTTSIGLIIRAGNPGA